MKVNLKLHIDTDEDFHFGDLLKILGKVKNEYPDKVISSDCFFPDYETTEDYSVVDIIMTCEDCYPIVDLLKKLIVNLRSGSSYTIVEVVDFLHRTIQYLERDFYRPYYDELTGNYCDSFIEITYEDTDNE